MIELDPGGRTCASPQPLNQNYISSALDFGADFRYDVKDTAKAKVEAADGTCIANVLDFVEQGLAVATSTPRVGGEGNSPRP